MKTKRIWIWAIIFGLIASGTLYWFLFIKDQEVSTNEPISEETANNTEQSKTAPELESDEEEETPTLVPVTPGMRAISIEVNVVEGVSWFLQPGNYVDVIALFPIKEDKVPAQSSGSSQGNESSGDDEVMYSTLLLQNTKILAIAKRKALDPPPSEELSQESVPNSGEADMSKITTETITLEIDPTDSTFLALVQHTGHLYLMLRAEGDHAKLVKTGTISLEDYVKGEIGK